MEKFFDYLSSVLSFLGVITTMFFAKNIMFFERENKKIKIKSKKGRIIDIYTLLLLSPVISALFQFSAVNSEGIIRINFIILSIMFPFGLIINLFFNIRDYFKSIMNEYIRNDITKKIIGWGIIIFNCVVFVFLSFLSCFTIYYNYYFIKNEVLFQIWIGYIATYILYIFMYVGISIVIGRYDEKQAKKITIRYNEYDKKKEIDTEIRKFKMHDNFIIYDSEDLSVRNIIPLDKIENIKIYYK